MFTEKAISGLGAIIDAFTDESGSQESVQMVTALRLSRRGMSRKRLPTITDMSSSGDENTAPGTVGEQYTENVDG